MSQRRPDYDALRAAQARAQESIVTYDPTDDPEGRALDNPTRAELRTVYMKVKMP